MVLRASAYASRLAANSLVLRSLLGMIPALHSTWMLCLLIPLTPWLLLMAAVVLPTLAAATIISLAGRYFLKVLQSRAQRARENKALATKLAPNSRTSISAWKPDQQSGARLAPCCNVTSLQAQASNNSTGQISTSVADLGQQGACKATAQVCSDYRQLHQPGTSENYEVQHCETSAVQSSTSKDVLERGQKCIVLVSVCTSKVAKWEKHAPATVDKVAGTSESGRAAGGCSVPQAQEEKCSELSSHIPDTQVIQHEGPAGLKYTTGMQENLMDGLKANDGSFRTAETCSSIAEHGSGSDDKPAKKMPVCDPKVLAQVMDAHEELESLHIDLVRLDARRKKLERGKHIMQQELDQEKWAQQQMRNGLRDEQARHEGVMAAYRTQMSTLVKGASHRQHHQLGQRPQHVKEAAMASNLSNSSSHISNGCKSSSSSSNAASHKATSPAASVLLFSAQQLQATEQHLQSLNPCAATLAAIHDAITAAEGYEKQLRRTIDQLENECRVIDAQLVQFDAHGCPSEYLRKHLSAQRAMHSNMERNTKKELLRLQARTRALVKHMPCVGRSCNKDASRNMMILQKTMAMQRKITMQRMMALRKLIITQRMMDMQSKPETPKGRATRSAAPRSSACSNSSGNTAAVRRCPAPRPPAISRVECSKLQHEMTSASDSPKVQNLLGSHRRMGESELVVCDLIQQVAIEWLW